jgi:hypothetical protein
MRGASVAWRNVPTAQVQRTEAQPREVSQVEKWLEPLTRGWQGGPNFHVLPSTNEFPNLVKQSMARQMGEDSLAETNAVRWGDDIFISAEKMNSPKQLAKTVAHEAIGHYGIENILGDRWPAVQQQVLALTAKDPSVKEAAAFVARNYQDPATGKVPDDVLASEIVARLAETSTSHPLIKRLMAQVREWLRRMGFDKAFPGIKFSRNDLQALLAQSAHYVRTGRGGAPSGVQPQAGYHGSPHKFELPSNEFMGSGEGAQAYGWGHYVAESKGTAKYYRDALGAPRYNYTKEIEEGGTLDQGAYLYEYDIPDATVDQMLDWDKPLSQQSEHVKDALAKYYAKDANAPLEWARELIDENSYDTGMHFYRQEAARIAGGKLGDPMAGIPRDEAATSKWLNDIGIPGIKYLDATSRGKGEGTRNLVLFDPQSSIKEVKRDGERVYPQAQIQEDPGSQLRRSNLVHHEKGPTWDEFIANQTPELGAAYQDMLNQDWETDLAIEFDRNLTGENAQVQYNFARQLLETPWEETVARYENLKVPENVQKGQVLSVDAFRELSDDYRMNRALSAGTHEPGSAAIKRLFREKLVNATEKAKALGRVPVMVFMAGGTGAGKTSALRESGFADNPYIIYDTNFAGFPSGLGKILAAREAGLDVIVPLIYRDPAESFIAGAVPRTLKMNHTLKGGGRTVPIDSHVYTHKGGRESLQKLLDWISDPKNAQKAVGINTLIVDNSRGRGNAAIVDSLAALPDPDYEALAEYAHQWLDENYANQTEFFDWKTGESIGTIRAADYEGFAGYPPQITPGADQATGAGPRAQPQQSEKPSVLEESWETEAKPGQPFRVYRFGRGADVLARRNAGNANSVGNRLTVLDDYESPQSLNAGADTISAFEVVADSFGGYKAFNQGRSDKEPGKGVGRQRGRWKDEVSYSFGDSGYTARKVGEVSLGDVRQVLKQQSGYDNFDMAGGANTARAVRQAFEPKIQAQLQEELFPPSPQVPRGTSRPSHIEVGGGKYSTRQFAGLNDAEFAIITEMMARSDASIAEQRGPKQTWTDLEQQAIADIVKDPQKVLDSLMLRQVGDTANSVQLEQYAITHLTALRQYQEAAARARETQSDEDLATMASYLEKMSLIMSPYAGYMTEAGRSLASIRKAKAANMEARRIIDMLPEQLMGKLSGSVLGNREALLKLAEDTVNAESDAEVLSSSSWRTYRTRLARCCLAARAYGLQWLAGRAVCTA